MTSPIEQKYAFGREHLGPAIALYLDRLRQTCTYFSHERGAAILFAARAGVRIRAALEVFENRAGRQVPEDWAMFWVSRLMIAKGIFADAPDAAIRLICDEFAHKTLGDLMRAVLRYEEDCEKSQFQGGIFEKPATQTRHLLKSRHSSVQPLRAHLQNQSALFNEALAALLGQRRSALIIDSGWAGTSQRLLASAQTDIDWWGAYFGLSGFGSTDRSHWNKAIGLVFQSDGLDPNRAATCTTAHRHMIECLFEPDAPSIEHYARNAKGEVIAPFAQANLDAGYAKETDPIYAGVLDHLGEAPLDPAALERDGQAAWDRLWKIILTPSAADARLYLDDARSADFGRSFKVPVLLSESDQPSRRLRLRQALWSQGQIALEYPASIAKALQTERLPKPKLQPASSTIAVITETQKGGPPLTKALAMVASQGKQHDVRHFIVVPPETAAPEKIGAQIGAADIDHSKVNLLVSSPGAALASIIENSTAEFVTFVPEEQNWPHGLLERALDHLSADTKKDLGGVIVPAWKSVSAEPLLTVVTEPGVPGALIVLRRERLLGLSGQNEQPLREAFADLVLHLNGLHPVVQLGRVGDAR